MEKLIFYRASQRSLTPNNPKILLKDIFSIGKTNSVPMRDFFANIRLSSSVEGSKEVLYLVMVVEVGIPYELRIGTPEVLIS